MRLDASTFPGVPFAVFHVELRRFLENVVWVNDETHCYAQRRPGFAVLCERTRGEFGVDVTRARRIEIHIDLQLVLIDPVDDFDWRAECDATASAAPAAVASEAS